MGEHASSTETTGPPSQDGAVGRIGADGDTTEAASDVKSLENKSCETDASTSR